MISYELMFLKALITTVIIEVLVLLGLWKLLFKKEKLEKVIFFGIVASTLTLPYVWFVFPVFFRGFGWIIFAELFAFLAESLIYKMSFSISWKIALVISFICNLASLLLGLIIF